VASVRNRCSIGPCYGSQTAAAGRLTATAARSRLPQRFGPLYGSLFAFVSACALSLSVQHYAFIEAAQRVAIRLERILQVLEELG
jgi:hypothetical protein